MSSLIIRTIQTPDNSPVSFPNGIRIGRATGAGDINNIGTPGQQGFGVGIAPSLPTGFAKLYGTEDPASDVYGNYQYSDGSVMCYIPAFFYKYGTGTNGLSINVVDVKPFGAYESVAAANAAGYALHRAFYNGGSIRPGVFVDKYMCSHNAGVASSIKNGIPLTSAARGSLSNEQFSNLTGAPADACYGAIAAAKTRGSIFFCNTRFIRAALALLANAHASASTNTTYCAWYSSGSTNFPKGCNNNALGDANDATIAYVSDGNGTYAGAGKTGSANFFAKTTHNGQNNGVADLNGNFWSIELGFTSNGSNFFLLNTSVDVATITGGNSLATDAWGATGLAAMYTDLGTTYGALTASNSNKVFGSASQVLSEATSGTAWAAAGAGIPLLAGVGGSNQFGSDYMLDYRPNELCGFSGGSWGNGSGAGVWALGLDAVRSASYGSVGFRSASYL
jgi:hypothetical protein